MTFGERLTQLRKDYGYNTRNEFAEKLGIPSTTLRNYETDVREPGHTFLKQISEFFNVSVDYLLCLTDDKEVLNSFRLRSSEQNLVEKYRLLDSHGQETVSYILDRELKRTEQLEKAAAFSQRPNTRIIQYFHKLASAGTGQFVFDDIPVEQIEIPDTSAYKHVSYAISIKGDSMEPLYEDGDVLLIDSDTQIEMGEIGVFLVDGNSYVKKLGNGELISLNENYPNIPLTEDSRYMGKVVDRLER